MNNLKTVYIDNEHSQHWLRQKQWANGILDAENVVFPNGKESHECALKVLEQAEDELIEDLALQVTG